VGRAYFWLTAARLSLATRGYRVTRRWFEAGPSSPQALAGIETVITSIDIATRNNLGSVGCLPRALAMYRLLRREGYQAELRIGVRRTATGMEAHAWVEVDGQPVAEPPGVALAYRPLARALQTSLLA
jgi:hypothetical protein